MTWAVTAVLARFGLAAVPGSPSDLPSSGHSGAIVERFETALGPVAVRGWPPGDLPRQRIEGLHALLAHVRRSGVVEVAAPFRTPEGQSLVDVDGRLWQVEPWMPGRAELGIDPTDDRLAAAVACLARWHAAARSFDAPRLVARWFGPANGPSPAVVERLKRIERWSSGDLDVADRRATADTTPFGVLARCVVGHFRRESASVRRELESFARERLPLQPCLRDVHAEHVLFEGNRVSGLIDPAACRTDNVAVDLARLLGDTIGGDVADGPPPSWERALDAYQRVGTMTIVERRLVRVLDRSAVLLMGLTWLDRCYFMQRSVPHDPRVLTRLRRIVARTGTPPCES